MTEYDVCVFDARFCPDYMLHQGGLVCMRKAMLEHPRHLNSAVLQVSSTLTAAVNEGAS